MVADATQPWYPTTCLLVRRDLFERLGGFDTGLFLCEEDKDLGLSLGKLGFKTVYTPDSLVVHTHGNESREYSKYRKDMRAILTDIRYFEKKWNCKVFIKHARSLLRNQGHTEGEIDRVRNLSFVNTAIEDDFNLSELILTVTNQCNHRCVMCYYHEHLNVSQHELSLDEYRKMSASIERLNTLWISGGEPFLRTDLVDICSVFSKNNKVSSLFIPTNGSRPDAIVEGVKNILEACPDTRLTIMFSLEGLPQEHDEIHDKAGAFASVARSIERLNFLRIKLVKKNQRFGILLNTVVSNKNTSNVLPLMEYVRSNIRVDSHNLSPLRGDPKDGSLSEPSGEQFSQLVARAKTHFAFYAERARVSAEVGYELKERLNSRYSLWTDILNGSSLPFTCQAGKLIGVLEPNGDIGLCESFPVVGNVRNANYSFRDIWFSDAAQESRKYVPGCSCTHACFIGASEGTLNG